jgi:hypothetical protein
MKSYLIFPLLSLLSVFVYPVCVYWYPKWQASAFFNPIGSLNDATHIMVSGKDGNFELVKLEKREKNDLSESIDNSRP